MFQASFEPNANLYTGMGQETAQADSLPDTSTLSFLCAALGKKSLVLVFICLTNSMIVFGVHLQRGRKCFVFFKLQFG